MKDIFASGYFDPIAGCWNTTGLKECPKQCGSFDKLNEQFSQKGRKMIFWIGFTVMVLNEGFVANASCTPWFANKRDPQFNCNVWCEVEKVSMQHLITYG